MASHFNNKWSQKILLMMIIALYGMPPAFALNPHKTINQYGHNIWLRHTGLPANAVNVCLQTGDGYLQLGTAAGLYRFDGVHFEWINTNPNDSKNRESVETMCESADGSLWIGAGYGKLSRLQNGNIRRYSGEDGISSNNMNAIVASRSGDLWLGTSYGLYRFIKGRFASVPINPMYITSITEDSTGRIWVGTHAGIRIFGADYKSQELKITGGSRNQMVTSLFTDHDGNVWIGTYDGLVRWKSGAMTSYNIADGLSDYRISAIFEDRDGNLWVGTIQGGVNRFSNSKWTSYGVTDGLSNNHVLSFAEDREGSLWVSTLDGLNQFKDVNITPFTVKEGLGSDLVSGIIETPDASLYFFCPEAATVTRFREGKIDYFHIPVGPVYLAKDSSLWIGQNGLLLNLKNDQIKRYDASMGLPAKWISAITEDNEGLVLYVNDVGIRRFVNGQLRPILLENGEVYSSTEYVSCFYSEPGGGALWIGTTGGLVKIQDGKSKLFQADDGITRQWIDSIFDDRLGSLWFASPYAGVSRYKNGKFTAYTSGGGLFTDEIYCVLCDDLGDLWMSSPRGIGHVSRQDLDDYEAGQIDSVHCQVYTSADGMKTDECFSEWQPAGWKGRDSRLWFATKKGAVVIDPKAFRYNELLPPVLIERVVVDQQAVPICASFKLPPGKGKLEFHYTALSFLVPERVHFKYRLEGYEQSWVDAGTRRVAYYTNLSPGYYRFHVIACNNDGMWNNHSTSIEFYLAPHFYETYWFLALSLCLAILIIFGVHRYRVRSLRAHERQLADLVHVRTEELQKQRSFLRKIVDLNPSFIFAKDTEGRFTLANRALAQAYGAKADDLVGKTESDFNIREVEVLKFRNDDIEVLESELEKFIPEEEFTDKEGKQHWMQVIKIPIISEDGNSHQVLGVATDITERKLAEERLLTSLHEKEVLLKEIHHRVKNNLQIVSSLLNLQAGQMADDKAKMALSECKQRVRSMALIHENLYRSENLAGIKFGDYLDRMMNELVRSFGKRGIAACFEVESIFLPIDVAIPCGLIVNELVTNALKYAFPTGQPGTITIMLRQSENGIVELGVKDDGVGFPPQIDLRSLKSMGITLVLSLTEQIGGTITLSQESGTLFSIAFPMKT
jgi:PAS domain S-box-containing protein